MLWFGLHSGSAPAVEARVYMLWYHMLWWRGRAVGAWADVLHVVVVAVSALCATVRRFGCWVGCLYQRRV